MAELLSASEIFFKQFEPKLQHRFIMYIEGIPSYIVRAVSRPSITINPVRLDHINTIRKVAGKAEWQDLTLTLHDPIVSSGAQAVMEWIRLHYESVTGRAGYTDFYKKDLTFNPLGPVGDKVEEWTVKGAFINSAQFGQFDWSTDEPANIELTISYDYAILQY